VALTQDGTFAIVNCRRDEGPTSRIEVWHIPSGKETMRFDVHATAVAPSPNGRLIVIGASRGPASGLIVIWDRIEDKAIRTLEGHTNRVTALAVSADQRRLISASEDHTVRLWDLQAGELLAVFTADSPILACAATPDCEILVAGDALGAVHFLHFDEVLSISKSADI